MEIRPTHITRVGSLKGRIPKETKVEQLVRYHNGTSKVTDGRRVDVIMCDDIKKLEEK